jgi:hypothetical protein
LYKQTRELPRTNESPAPPSAGKHEEERGRHRKDPMQTQAYSCGPDAATLSQRSIALVGFDAASLATDPAQPAHIRALAQSVARAHEMELPAPYMEAQLRSLLIGGSR